MSACLEKSTYFFFLIVKLSLLLSNLSTHDCLSMDIAKSIHTGAPNKPITVLNKNITLEEAYCGQEKLNYLINKKHKDKIGYKIGFTGKALQKRFNVEMPATGVIYEHMFLDNGATIAHDFGYRTFIEPDFLIIIKSSNIMSSKTPLEALSYIKTIHPFLELPALRFQEGKEVNGKMMIAANILATKMLMGEGVEVESSEEFLNKLASIETLLLDQNNNVIQKAITSNIMGNPINALMWLINDFNNRGIKLKENDRISLGSVGKIYPLKKNTKYLYKFIGFKKDLQLTVKVD